MKQSRIFFSLSLCLLGAFAAWLSEHRAKATHPNKMVSDSAPGAETVAPSTREVLGQVPAEPLQVKHEIRRVGGGLALTNANSPGNSQDLDKNREWARNFPAEAAIWLKTSPESEQRIAIAEIMCSYLAQTNPAAAVSLAENCAGDGTNSATQSLVDSMAQQWAEQNMPAASAWALAKPAGEQRDRLLQRIAMVQAKTSPGAAARLIAEQMSPGDFQNEATISVLHQWTKQDALAALAWVEAFPAGDLRDRAIREVENVSAVSEGNPPVN